MLQESIEVDIHCNNRFFLHQNDNYSIFPLLSSTPLQTRSIHNQLKKIFATSALKKFISSNIKENKILTPSFYFF